MFKKGKNNRGQTPGLGVVLQQPPEKRIKKVLLEKKHTDSIYLNLRKVILLDSQSTMNLLCTEDMVKRVYNSKKKIRLRINRGKWS